MDTQVLELLVGTQSPVDDIRKGAENQLEQLYTNGNEAFPLSLASIAHHVSVPTNLRQSALLVLKTFVLRAWSPSLDEFAGKVLISDANKEELRQTLLSIATTGHEDRKVVAAASYVVSKIASADFPEAWPALLSTLLDLVPRTTDDQLHGVLTVLSDLVEDGFDEDQFSESARDLIKCLYDVAVDGGKKLTLRALSVSIFRACFDTMELVYQNNKASVKQFMQEASDAWSPFFIDVLKTPLPAMPSEDEEAQGGPAVVHWRGLVALKIQVVKVNASVIPEYSNRPLLTLSRLLTKSSPCSPSFWLPTQYICSAQYGKRLKHTLSLTSCYTSMKTDKADSRMQIDCPIPSIS